MNDWSEEEAKAECIDLRIKVCELEAEIEELRDSRHEAMEIYAGMEGFIPETAPEAYCLRIIEQMYNALIQDKGGK